MRFLSMLAAAFFLALGAVGSAQAQGKQDFVLINATGYAIAHVYVSKVNDDDWGDDILGKDVMDDGDTLTIQFPRKGSACKWDLMVTYDDDDSNAIWRGFDLCKISQITLKYNRKTDTTTALTQ